MRKTIIAAAFVGTALTLTACSESPDTTADPATEGALADTGAAMPAAGDEGARSAVLDANTVTAEQLAGMDGVSPELAAAIVANQPYATAVDLNATLLETLTAEQAAAVRSDLFVPVNLNSASREEIALIPGMTDRMVGEFLEYRPYEDMNEFNREIGKYVDEEEVARFRNYVTL
ncbi:hypothetical protein [Pseudopontixanthobacter vadosimaris]|uniref:hypothetical protein n=1 Tax=Pseudopontixanthobacter vadosimaris TaxID=2726450 RepID=UPI001474A59E|nr:hypothetical protein [Pseudopontixanthobacter vadosimaris]